MKLIICIGMMLVNFIIYFVIGMLPLGRRQEKSASTAIVAGFFMYYGIFTLFCVPIMVRWRPLSLLTTVWTIAVSCLFLFSFLWNRKYFATVGKSLLNRVRIHWKFCVGVFLVVLVEMIVILYSYQFTLDAAYYVANVTTSLQTNSLNIYDPYTGDWQDHFEMRYFFSTYPMNDAVVCKLTGIHPLMQVKIIMAGVAILLTNLLYYMIGKELFGDKKEPIFYLIFFAGIMNFFFITIFTSSNFLITRTYEGKSLLGNVVLPMVFYLFLRIWKGKKEWLLLFLVCFGSTVLSSSSNMLVPATLAVLFFPLAMIRKDIKIIIKTVVCMIPCIIMLLVYVAYVKGMFVFYTYPR